MACKLSEERRPRRPTRPAKLSRWSVFATRAARASRSGSSAGTALPRTNRSSGETSARARTSTGSPSRSSSTTGPPTTAARSAGPTAPRMPWNRPARTSGCASIRRGARVRAAVAARDGTHHPVPAPPAVVATHGVWTDGSSAGHPSYSTSQRSSSRSHLLVLAGCRRQPRGRARHLRLAGSQAMTASRIIRASQAS